MPTTTETLLSAI